MYVSLKELIGFNTLKLRLFCQLEQWPTREPGSVKLCIIGTQTHKTYGRKARYLTMNFWWWEPSWKSHINSVWKTFEKVLVKKLWWRSRNWISIRYLSFLKSIEKLGLARNKDITISVPSFNLLQCIKVWRIRLIRVRVSMWTEQKPVFVHIHLHEKIRATDRKSTRPPTKSVTIGFIGDSRCLLLSNVVEKWTFHATPQEFTTRMKDLYVNFVPLITIL